MNLFDSPETQPIPERPLNLVMVSKPSSGSLSYCYASAQRSFVDSEQSVETKTSLTFVDHFSEHELLHALTEWGSQDSQPNMAPYHLPQS
ncbi:hypothetical protein NQZ79_g7817 [Umbelopsis isabellina]|nr:hypothetical protein NQZ79_g7817 [Umbelopsis isabellina]